MSAMWGLLFSALTIGVSVLGKKEEVNDKMLAKHPFVSEILKGDNRIFISGAVLGLGCSVLFSTISSQFRVVEQFRLFWRYFWNTNERANLFPFRRPTTLADAGSVAEILRSGVEVSDDGSIQLLVTPQTIATSYLHISVLTIENGREIPCGKAPAVEFYYVVSCPETGSTFSQQGVVETSCLKPGDFFCVDAGNMRWVSNRSGTSPLVLLRATDGGYRYNNIQSTEKIRMDPTLKKNLSKNTGLFRASTVDLMKDGLRQMQHFALKYVNSFSN